MRLPEGPSSPFFPVLDPIILDGKMDGPYHDGDLDFFNTSGLPSANAGREFDELFSGTPTSQAACTSPSDLRVRKPFSGPNPLGRRPISLADSPSESPDDSSLRSSSESPGDSLRGTSMATTTTAPMVAEYESHQWLNATLLMEKEGRLLGYDAEASLDNGFTADADLESSNKVMDSAFDFDSAASSPSPLKVDKSSLSKGNETAAMQARSSSSTSKKPTRTKIPPTLVSVTTHLFWLRILSLLWVPRFPLRACHFTPIAREKTHQRRHRCCQSKGHPLQVGVDALPLLFWRRRLEASA
jgi:hypothetical protein